MSALRTQNKIVVIGIAFYVIAIFLIVFKLPPYSTYEAHTQVNLLFTAYLVLFAVIEGYSTYMQVVQNDRQFRIEDTRFELENVYGRLYTLIAKNVESIKDKNTGIFMKYSDLDEKEFEELIDMLVKYSYIIPEDFYHKFRDGLDLWEDGINSVLIPENYYKLIIYEYHKKVNEYRKLLGKEPILFRKREQEENNPPTPQGE